MKNRELKEYLETFLDEEEVRFLLANPQKRKLYDVNNLLVITDTGYPVFCIEVGNEKPMDEDMIKACEEDEKGGTNLPGQMNIADFPEVMP